MSRPPWPWVVLALTGGVLLGGCGRPAAAGEHDGHEHAAHEQSGDNAPVRFKEGVGLQLAPETAAAIGLKTGEVVERPVRRLRELTAAVFEAGPPSRASSLVPVELADDLERDPPSEARLLAVHRQLSAALGQVEVVLALPGNPPVGSMINLTLRGAVRTGTAVPRSALLRTPAGAFVYVANGANLLRTAVKPGAEDGAYVEILDGLYAGDVVATDGVEQLWLTELRLTKGGGHCH